MKRVKITKPWGRKPKYIGAILLKEVSNKAADDWHVEAKWKNPDRKKKWFTNWPHAEEFAAKENKKLDLLKEKGAGRYTVNDACDSYLKEREARSKAKDNTGCTLDTLMTLQGTIEKHVRPNFGRIRLAELSSQQIEDWVIQQSATAKPITMKNRLDRFNRVLNHAVKYKMLLVNPLTVNRVKVPGKIRKEAIIPDRSDLEVLRQYLMGPRPVKHGRFAWSCARVIVLLAVSCGLRRGECSGLTWDDIDPDTGDIDINKARGRYQGIKGPKTDAGIRKVPTTPLTREIINEHAEVYKQFYGKCVGFVLRSNNKDRDYLPPETISVIFNRTMHECGLVDPDTNQIKFSHHKGRHWFGSHSTKSTADIHLVKKWMGHKNASMTLDVYGHCLDDGEGRAKFQKMPDWLAPVIQIDAPSATPPVEMTALPTPEDTFEFGAKVNDGNVVPAPECPIHVPSIAKPWVEPFIKLLHGGMPLNDAYYEIMPQFPNLRATKNPKQSAVITVRRRVCAEFRRLKLPEPKSVFARFRAERMLKLHGQGYQAYEIASKVECSKTTVHEVLGSRHKGNANNPLNRKLIPSVQPTRKPQPEHKIQLKLL